LVQFTYGDIPDSVPSKRLFPLGEYLWNLHKELGWEYFLIIITDNDVGFNRGLAEAVSEKFRVSVDSARAVLEGRIKNPKEVLTTWFFPPLIYVRSDLQIGTTKLIYGDSTDITFVVINDATFDVDLLINGHMEDGMPVDYWYILGDDEIFDRRHMKLGLKLREIPKTTKDFIKTGYRILDILRDVRNERTPEFSDSAYSMCMLWVSAGINMQCDLSNYGNLAEVWDGLSAKKAYGMPDYWFCYVPWPSMLNLLMMMGRYDWTIKMTGLLTNHQLFLNAFEPKLMDLFKNNTPELWNFIFKNVKKKGIPTPEMTLNCKPPDLKNKKKFQDENFIFKYPNKNRILPFEWDLTDDEVFSGILTDITFETPPELSYSKKHIVSIGVGN